MRLNSIPANTREVKITLNERLHGAIQDLVSTLPTAAARHLLYMYNKAYIYSVYSTYSSNGVHTRHQSALWGREPDLHQHSQSAR